MPEAIPLIEGKDFVSRRDLNVESEHLKELLKKEIELIGEKFRSRDENLRLQAIEYERRLEDLNGEAARIKKVQEETIPREVFDRTIDAIKEKHEREIQQLDDKIGLMFKTVSERSDERLGQLQKDIKVNSDYRTKQEGKTDLAKYIPTVITLLISIAAIVFVILNYNKK